MGIGNIVICRPAGGLKPEWTRESKVAQAALLYFGHVVREERGMESDARGDEWE